jgi:hypothetical protein
MKMYLATILGSIGVLNLMVSYFFGVAGLTYGLVDQGVLMLGAYLGWELDPWIESRFKGARPGLGILIGALVGNTISDCAGAILDPDMRVMVFGITNGCLIPLLFVPLIEKWKAWREESARISYETIFRKKIAESLHAESLAEGDTCHECRRWKDDCVCIETLAAKGR